MQKKTGGAGQFRAIEGISGQRVPRGGEMRPDLVARALADAAADEHERGMGIIGFDEAGDVPGGQGSQQGNIGMPHRIGIVGMAHPRLVPRVRIQTAGHGEIVERLAFYQGQIQFVRVADALGQRRSPPSVQDASTRPEVGASRRLSRRDA